MKQGSQRLVRERSRRAPGRVTTALIAAMLVASACGSNASNKKTAQPRPEPAADAATSAAAAPALTAPTGGGDPAAATADPASAAAPVSRTGDTSPSAKSVAKSPAAARTPSGTGVTPGPGPSPASPSAAASPAPQPGPSPAPAGPAPPVPAPGGKKSEIVLGSFGTESGVLGAVSGPAPPAIRAWVAQINARGGLNGHPVRVILADDAGDAAKGQGAVRQMVERDKVIAFFNEYSFSTLSAVKDYLKEKQIPVIGSIGADSSGDYTDMLFNPLVGADVGQAWGFINNVLSQTNKKKLGALYCREAAVCAAQKKAFAKLLPYQGLELVYEAQVSLAQPDHTAEVIGAQRAGAEVLLLLLDSASVARVARSAHRQGYEPVLAGTYNLNQDLIYSGGTDVEGLLLTSRSAPWDSSPKLKDYRDAMAKYQPEAPRGDLGGGVFVVGRLIEEKIAPFISEPPTSAQFLAGLYALKGETLGGLLPGITFNKGQHFNVNQCIVPTKLTHGKFVAHDAAESFVCAPDWKPGT